MKMLYERVYERHEIAELLGTNTRQGITRKLTGYGVFHLIEGRGENFTINIKKISDHFKMFCILELEFAAQTDFKKLRDFLWYYFNDDEFMTMPDEVKAQRMIQNDYQLTRQTIGNYTRKLTDKGYIYRDGNEYIYYFARKGQQIITDEKTYKQAWREYWIDKEGGCPSDLAIFNMVAKYGGYARKQPIPLKNAFYVKEMEVLLDLIGASIENEIDEKAFESNY